jgi:predicted nucleic acid-binding protein
VIFLDTSAIFALADTNDLNHQPAVDLFGRAIAAGESFLVHNYVLIESAALLQRRLSFDSALRLLRDAEEVEVHWVTSSDHLQAVSLLEERRRRQLSLVDCMSFVVMRERDTPRYLAFDADFAREGFAAFGG